MVQSACTGRANSRRKALPESTPSRRWRMARHRFWLVGLAVVAVPAILVVPRLLVASDHDDGETDMKGRDVNLTDLYAFREGGQTRNAAQKSNLSPGMNTNSPFLARPQ